MGEAFVICYALNLCVCRIVSTSSPISFIMIPICPLPDSLFSHCHPLRLRPTLLARELRASRPNKRQTPSSIAPRIRPRIAKPALVPRQLRDRAQLAGTARRVPARPVQAREPLALGLHVRLRRGRRPGQLAPPQRPRRRRLPVGLGHGPAVGLGGRGRRRAAAVGRGARVAELLVFPLLLLLLCGRRSSSSSTTTTEGPCAAAQAADAACAHLVVDRQGLALAPAAARDEQRGGDDGQEDEGAERDADADADFGAGAEAG
jgi:hypothetical protein